MLIYNATTEDLETLCHLYEIGYFQAIKINSTGNDICGITYSKKWGAKDLRESPGNTGWKWRKESFKV